MKKIAFYSRGWYTGGMENAVYNLCRLLLKTGEYEITILYKDSNEQTQKMMKKLEEVAKVKCVNNGRYVLDVLINCDRKDFELPNVNTKKYIHWFSSCLIDNRDKLFGKAVTQSQWHYDQLKKLGIESTIIGNPLDVENIIELSKEKIDFVKPENEIMFLVVSRISYEKGFDRISRFMEGHIMDKTRLYVVGGVTQPRHEPIKTRIMQLLRTKVVFLGEFDNPYPYIAQADYVLCLSDNEIYGLVSEEAHILGKQVIFNRYHTAYDQFLLNYDIWFDQPTKKYEGNIDGFWKLSLENNMNRFKKWKEIIDG